MRDNHYSIERDRTRRHIARVAIGALVLGGLLALAVPAAAQSKGDHDNGGGDPWPLIPPIVGPFLDPAGQLVVWILDTALQGYRR
jgi:hypothetical protein